MEKNFTNAVLLSATVVVACLVVFPPLHLWAENDIQIDEKIRMHRATIQEISGDRMIVSINDQDVPVTLNASTTVGLGTGDEGTAENLQAGANIYVFGTYNRDVRAIEAERIVIRNKRIMERTAPSRAEQERMKASSTFSSLDILGLTSR